MVKKETQAVGCEWSLTLMLLIDSHGDKQKGDRLFASFVSLVVARAKTRIGNENDKKDIFTRVRANFHWCWRRLRWYGTFFCSGLIGNLRPEAKIFCSERLNQKFDPLRASDLQTVV